MGPSHRRRSAIPKDGSCACVPAPGAIRRRRWSVRGCHDPRRAVSSSSARASGSTSSAAATWSRASSTALVRDDGVVGVTSNPTIFQQAITESRDYDAAIAGAARPRASTGRRCSSRWRSRTSRAPATGSAPSTTRTEGRDGRVSIEVSPRLAHDTRRHASTRRAGCTASVARAQRDGQDPGDRRGPARDRAPHRRGHQHQRHADLLAGAATQQVMDAYLTGLERRAGAQASRSTRSSRWRRSSSRASTPRSTRRSTSALAALPADATERRRARERSAARRRSRTRGSPTPRFREVFAAPRFARARARRARALQRPLWASTSTKNPAYRDVAVRRRADRPRHREHDAAADARRRSTTTACVESRDRARPGRRAGAVRAGCRSSAIPIDALIDELEPEGVAAFAKSYDALIEALEAKRRELVSRGASA